MFQNTDNCTVIREQIKRMRGLIEEYHLVKQKKHPHFKFASDFFKCRNIKKQNFFKYYHRYASLAEDNSLLPAKRGPKNPHKRLPALINKVSSLRQTGLSRFEIHAALTPILKHTCPSPSSIYNILKDEGLNRLRPPQKRCKRMIIREKAGELGHFDCYHLPKGIISGNRDKFYLVGGIDDATRLAWVELLPDVTALSVMFGSMQIMRLLQERYNVRFTTIMSDNGSEFKGSLTKHPFEKLLQMLEVKHIYTPAYKPQQNGKIERFWRTLYEDVLEEAEFSSVENLKDELQQYLLYYNELRPHQSLTNKTPQNFNEFCQRNS
jgi:hypothetical protein